MDNTKRILIAEDEEADIMLIKIILNKSGLADRADIARDGQETLDYLYKKDAKNGLAPLLILLDLKLPKVTGLEILQFLRADKRFTSVPVVIFTSSSDEKDRTECLASGANDFVIKPIDFEAFNKAVKKVIEDYVYQVT